MHYLLLMVLLVITGCAAYLPKSSLAPKIFYRHGPVEQITDESGGADGEPDLSADNRWLAFTSTRHSLTPQVYLKSLRDGSLIQKTEGPYHNVSPRLSPDGRWLALSSDRSGNFDIWVMPVDEEGAAWQVTAAPEEERWPAWSPDGKRIAYGGRDEYGRWQLWSVEIASRRRTYLCPGEHPSWSPDGTRIAFQRASSQAPGWYAIWLFQLGTGHAELAVSAIHWGAIQPSWSPDGQWLAFTSVAPPVMDSHAEQRQIWLCALPGRHLTKLTHYNTGGEEHPAWGENGFVYFSYRTPAGQQIWRLKPDVTKYNLSSATP